MARCPPPRKSRRAKPTVQARLRRVGHAQQNSRRTKEQIAIIKADIRAILEHDRPMTVRQVFYQLVARGTIEKTEEEYQGTVIRMLTNMRLGDEIPFNWIVDESRRARETTLRCRGATIATGFHLLLLAIGSTDMNSPAAPKRRALLTVVVSVLLGACSRAQTPSAPPGC